MIQFPDLQQQPQFPFIQKVIELPWSICLPFRWWVCWTLEVSPTSHRVTMPSPHWRAAWSPLLAWRPAAASAWTISRAWRVSPASRPCPPSPRCPAPSPTARPPTARQATPSTMWRPTSTASTDKVRSIDFTFSLFYPVLLHLLFDIWLQMFMRQLYLVTMLFNLLS